jgi:hypothetical protein
MANQNDSFIDEVTDELRRDKLYGAFRRYGWIGILIILIIVGGAAWREYSQSRDRAAAENWGDAVLAAVEAQNAEAIQAVDPAGSQGRKALSDLLAANTWISAGDEEKAAAALRDVAGGEAADVTLRDLAQLKLVMLEGQNMDPAERDATLTRISRAGAPFELLALEQKAVALVGAGRSEDAITLIRQIQQKDGLSEGLRRRLSEMMIALGVEPEANDAMTAPN